MTARHPFLGGLAGGAGVAFAAVMFGVLAQSLAVFAVTLVVVACAALATTPVVPARVAGLVTGIVAALVLGAAATYAYMVDTML